MLRCSDGAMGGGSVYSHGCGWRSRDICTNTHLNQTPLAIDTDSFLGGIPSTDTAARQMVMDEQG